MTLSLLAKLLFLAAIIIIIVYIRNRNKSKDEI